LAFQNKNTLRLNLEVWTQVKSSFSEGVVLSFKMRGVLVILRTFWAQNDLSNKSKQTFVVGCYAIFSYIPSDIPVLQAKSRKSHKIEIPE
jgi:hypothetical protein